MDYLLPPENEDFYLRQVMILIGELLELIERNKAYLKKEKHDELFKVLAGKVKTVLIKAYFLFLFSGVSGIASSVKSKSFSISVEVETLTVGISSSSM